MRRLRLIFGLCVAFAALPGSAGATTTIGSDLAIDPNAGLGGDGTFIMTAVRSASSGLSLSTVDGVIVKWRLRYLKNNQSIGLIALRVAAPDGNKFRGKGKSAPVDPPAATDNSAVPTTTEFFPTRVGINAGDYIGVDLPDQAFPRVMFSQVAGNGARTSSFLPPLAEGESRDNSFTEQDTEALIQAVVEPDADADGFGDETQDNCPSASNPTQADTDADGTADGCDPDDDNDGISDADEAARGTDPLSSDSDGDGRTDPTDNCPALANVDQADTDGDLSGNACDPDDDNDGIADDLDVPPRIDGPSQLGTIKPARSGSITLKGVTVTCTVACVVKVDVKSARKVRLGKRSKRKIVRFGRATKTLQAGSGLPLSLKLSRGGRAALKRLGSVKSTAAISVSAGGAGKAQKTVRFKLKRR